MGLRPLDLRQWTRPPDRAALTAELDRKDRLLAAHAGVVVVTSEGCAPAAGELLALLIHHLTRDHDDRYRPGPDGTVVVDGARAVDVSRGDPLVAAARLVAGDWCLIRAGEPPVLAAGVVCSPNRWRLPDKVGLPVSGVHGPVPGYRAALGTPVDRLLGPDGRTRPLWRQNWSLLGDPTLFQPDGGADPAAVPDGVWVRSERQTLVPLERSGWWVFGIETTQAPLGELAGRPELAGRVRAAVDGLDPETSAYKGLRGWRDPLTAWLAMVAGSGEAAQGDERAAADREAATGA